MAELYTESGPSGSEWGGQQAGPGIGASLELASFWQWEEQHRGPEL